MVKLTAQSVNLGLNVVVITSLVVCLILAGWIMRESHKTALLLSLSKELAQEMRQSSDDLTRFIRTYTVTGNASYWDYFNQVINIRDGLAPLPVQPWRNYWDLYITDGHPPRGFLAPSSLNERFVEAKFTDKEFALLTESKRQSDALIDLENVAYNAMNGRYRPTDTTGLTPTQALEFSVVAAPNQTLAMQLVHSTAYHHWKGQIMRPLDEFAASANQRVMDSINQNYQINIILVAFLAIMLGCLILLLGLYFGKIAKDTQTAQLLNTVLPTRVVDSVNVQQFTELKVFASKHAKDLKKLHKRNAYAVSKGLPLPSSASSNGQLAGFPVLYSEFLPLAWVAFTDVVKFTAMCRYTPAKTVISILNELFSLLDVEANSHRVEKIKTIGDAFMCAKLSTSELHGAISEHDRMVNIARDGAEMVKFLLRAIRLAQGVAKPEMVANATGMNSDDDDGSDTDLDKDEHESAKNFLQLRVGLHAGPVASGIVGFERPLYDLFGDTVNTAARLESSGKPNRIQVMETTTQLFDEYLRHIEFECGVQEVELKGIGKASTRFIKSIRMPNSEQDSYLYSNATEALHAARKSGSVMVGAGSPAEHDLKSGGVSSANYIIVDSGCDSEPNRVSPKKSRSPSGQKKARRS